MELQMSRNAKAGLAAALVLMGAGLVFWFYQLSEGLVLTNMRNSFSWGLYVSGLAFFVGNAAGGLVLTSSIYMFGATALKPFARIGALTAFANVTAAMIVIVPDIGRPSRLYNLLVHPNFFSPLMWDVIVLNLYAVVSLGYLYLLMLPDLKGRWEKLAINVSDRKAFSERWAKRIAPFSLLVAIGIHVVTAWIFATQGARGWWHSAVLAPDFVALAMASGTALVLFVCMLTYGQRPEYQGAYRMMSLFIATTFFIHLFFMYNDFVIEGWYGTFEAQETLSITLQQYGTGHFLEVVLPLLAVVLLLIPAARSRAGWVMGACLMLMFGVLVHRYMLMPAAFNANPMTIAPLGTDGMHWSLPIASGEYGPGVDVFVNHWAYFPSSVEIVIFLGVLAFMGFVILAGIHGFPIIKKEAV